MNRRLLILVGFVGLPAFSCTKDLAPETTPPWTIGDLVVRTTPQGFHLRWTATGDDGNVGRASRYDVRFAASNLATGWGSAHIVPSPLKPSSSGHLDSLSVLGIGLGPWEFGIKIGDEAGNWSAISNIVTASIDTIPPASITDLTVRTTVQGFYLRWTAPSDDGNTGRAAGYDIRYAATNLAGAWESANIVPSPPTPGIAGQIDSTRILGIGLGPWEFGIKSADGSGNLSSLSNVVTTTIPDDSTPPAAVTDLSVDLVTEQSVVLLWTASGDDGAVGQAFSYDVRYSESPITPQNWDSATRVQWVGTVHQSGQRELFTVPNLQSGPTYYFALRVLDEVENASALSNIVSAASVSSPVQLTFDPKYGAADPDWSPDGQSIAFGGHWYTQPDAIPVIYVIPSTGGNAVRYTSDYSAGVSWSPDGRKFAFSLYVDEHVRTVLALMDASPGATFKVLIDPGVKSTGSARWSPDGSRIAYVASTYAIGELPTSHLYTIPSPGGTPEHLYGGWTIGGLDWSPDGTQIVYSSNESGSYDLWVMPSDGGVGTQLTTSAGKEFSPAWSPDGSKIAYEGDGQIWVIYLAGRNRTQVTFDSDKSVFRSLAWSPDGTAIAYAAMKESIPNIWVLRVK